jgi:hypothetical protein
LKFFENHKPQKGDRIMDEYTITIEYNDGKWDTFQAFLKDTSDYEVGAEVLAHVIAGKKSTCDIKQVIVN